MLSKPDLKHSNFFKEKVKVDADEFDHSLVLNESKNTSFSKRLQPKELSKEGTMKKTGKFFLKPEKQFAKQSMAKIKSEEILPLKSCSSPKSFSVRKHFKANFSRDRQSVESIESKKVDRFETKDGWKQKSYLKQTQNLKKTSSRMKLKVKDPFERKIKLDSEFQDESLIGHRQ